jgi:hypothetical protein
MAFRTIPRPNRTHARSSTSNPPEPQVEAATARRAKRACEPCAKLPVVPFCRSGLILIYGNMLDFSPKSVASSALSRLTTEGRFAVVTNVGCGMRWTCGAPDERGLRGRQSRVVLAPRRWCQVREVTSLADDGGNKARSPGRARAMGAACTRPSLRPCQFEGDVVAKLGRDRAARRVIYCSIRSSLRAKRRNPDPLRGDSLDCFGAHAPRNDDRRSLTPRATSPATAPHLVSRHPVSPHRHRQAAPARATTARPAARPASAQQSRRPGATAQAAAVPARAA